MKKETWKKINKAFDGILIALFIGIIISILGLYFRFLNTRIWGSLLATSIFALIPLLGFWVGFSDAMKSKIEK